MELTRQYKDEVLNAVVEARKNYGGDDKEFAKMIGLHPMVYPRVKDTSLEACFNNDTLWIKVGRKLNIKVYSDDWNIARTAVYNEIESSLEFCQRMSKSMILVDECGIGKTFCTKHIVSKMKNTFYVDCSQAKTKFIFIRLLAKALGMDDVGRYQDIKDNVKYYLATLEKPLIVLDEAGDLDYPAFMEIKELWNGTDGICGWYMIGADGLRAKVEKGIKNQKVGFAEIFSRFSDGFIKLVPNGKDDRKAFYSQLLGDVATINLEDKSEINPLIRKCLDKKATLRHLETLVRLKKDETTQSENA